MRFDLWFLPFFFVACAVPQQAKDEPADNLHRTSPYFDAGAIDFSALVVPPPAADSAAGRADMQAVLRAQQSRSPKQVADAQRDDKEEDMFVFATVFGPRFNAAELPATAKLSTALHQAASAADPPLKVFYHRPRPFRANSAVHPICDLSASDAYPSGHSMSATLEALALTQIVPERRTAILERLDGYLQNRVVCGVHFPSDTAASRSFSYVLFGLISASPRFQADLAAARKETRHHLEFIADRSAPVP